jgi:hypothetical protein
MSRGGATVFGAAPEKEEVLIEASCHCGAVRLAIDNAPTEVTDCNCSICRRYGVLWAYCPTTEVQVSPPTGATAVYMCNDRSQEFHRCAHCGCVTHWRALDPARTRMGVNARLMQPDVLAKARIRRLDGAVTDQYLDD